MAILELLRTLNDKRILLSVDNGRLRTAAPKGAITAELADLIGRRKGELIEFLERVSGQEHEVSSLRIRRGAKREAYPLSFSQQRLWFIDQLEGGSRQYHIPLAFQLEGELDGVALQGALDAIVERHAVLRSRFQLREGEVVQVPVDAVPVPLARVDLGGETEELQACRVQELAVAEAERAFDLGADLMLRCTLVRLGPRRHVILFTLHHIAADGWSLGVLVKEFVGLYQALGEGRESPLAELPIQYADYACWQREAQEGGLLERELSYWQGQLAGMPALHSLPLDHPRPARQGYQARRHGQTLDVGLLERLRRLAQEHEATLFMVLQGAFAALLSRWGGATDVVMGTPVAGRQQPETEPLIGFFINTLVFRSDLSGDPSLGEVVSRARHTALEAYAHQQVPFDLLVETLRPERELSYNPVCQVKFVLQNHEVGELELPGLKLSPVSRGVERVRFDLDLTAMESSRGLHLSWTYKEELFEAGTIERMARAYGLLLEQLVESPETRLSELRLVGEAEAQELRIWGCGPVVPAGRERSLAEGIEEQAERTPEAVAVRCGDRRLSYRELNGKANRLAHYLREQEVGPGSRVGVALERSVELLIALLGVMKSGASYVPLDGRQTVSRRRGIAEDAGLACVVQERRQGLLLGGVDAVYLDEACGEGWLAGYPESNPEPSALESAAYVIYTSGSTGK
ncbi:MAG TPA: condensation domain-containing protein, partial [Vicinamibacteria bacterium]